MKIIKQNKLRKPIQLLVGRPEETAAREANAGVAQTRRSPGLAPALGSATDVWDPRNRETDRDSWQRRDGKGARIAGRVER